MNYVERLRGVVLKELQSERVGTPLFARLMIEISPDHGHLLDIVTGGIQLTESFLQSRVETLLALGDVKSGHLSAQLKLEGGRSGLVTAALVRNDSPRFDLRGVGNRGTLRHSPTSDALSGEFVSGDWATKDSPQLATSRCRVLEESLRSGGTVRLGKE